MNGRIDEATPPTYVFDTNRIRREGFPRLKLPDAIIAATAVVFDAQLITTDDKLLRLVWPGFRAAALSSS
jgi:predicted nucleic acid-binding protein